MTCAPPPSHTHSLNCYCLNVGVGLDLASEVHECAEQARHVHHAHFAAPEGVAVSPVGAVGRVGGGRAVEQVPRVEAGEPLVLGGEVDVLREVAQGPVFVVLEAITGPHVQARRVRLGYEQESSGVAQFGQDKQLVHLRELAVIVCA